MVVGLPTPSRRKASVALRIVFLESVHIIISIKFTNVIVFPETAKIF
jgi:hypothetical protein